MYMSDVSAMVLVVFYLPICIGVIWLVNRSLKKGLLGTWIRRVLLACLSIVMFLLPTWDAILGKYYLDKFCEGDGGTYLNRSERVAGIYFDERPRDDIAKAFLKRGFDFIEMGQEGDYFRYFLNKNLNLTSIKVTTLLSKYIIAYESSRTRVGPNYLNITVANQFLEHMGSKERLGGFRNYQMYTRLDKTWEGIGALQSTRCTDITKFNTQDKFQKKTKYLDIVANIKD
jgi:hypothetical protein